MIKAVVFDCFGVLYGGALWAQLEICPPERRQQLIDNNKQNDYGYITPEQHAANAAAILGMPVDQYKTMLQYQHVRNEPLFDEIRLLRSQGYKTALLSNAGKNMPYELFSEQDLHGGLFDTYIVSSEQGIAKPNPAIFEAMADKLGVASSECVMIDDTPENCEGAEVAGMQAIQHVRNDETLISLRKLLQSSI